MSMPTNSVTRFIMLLPRQRFRNRRPIAARMVRPTMVAARCFDKHEPARRRMQHDLYGPDGESAKPRTASTSL